MYESCDKDEDSMVEVLAAVVSAIEETWKSLKKATMVDEEVKIPKFDL